jgi:serine protease DegQ
MQSVAERPAGALAAYSDRLADAVEQAAASVVQVNGRPRQAASGIIWSADGLIVTAAHVLERSDGLTIGLPDGRSVPAKLLGRDAGTDLALLRVSAGDLAPIAHATPPRLGHVVLIVARPEGTPATSRGVVSSVEGVTISPAGGQIDGIIRTDAAFYPGFSGGAAVDSTGALIGLATSHFGPAGVAISTPTIERVAAALLRHGRIRNGFLGIRSQPVPLPTAMRAAAGVSQESALLVVGVDAAGPAARSGMLVGDILVTLDGEPVRRGEDLMALLNAERVGRAAIVQIVRGGVPITLTATIGERGKEE